MTWTLYRWVWQLRSPLHIGLTPAGALNRTRLYIPARSMWAALTAEIARRLKANAFPDYTGVGQALQRHTRFTYLYPAERVNGRWFAWLPRYEQEEKRAGLYWCRADGVPRPVPDRRFRQRLLYTQPSTAISPGTGTADDGTLREVEYIQPYWRPEKASKDVEPHPVAFVGYIFLRNALPSHIAHTLQEIRELYLGGETRYGFGHLTLLPYSDQHPWEQINTCFGFPVYLAEAMPRVTRPEYVAAHASISASKARGDWEVLVRWDWQTMQAENRPLWQPGTRITEEESFVIRPDGLWEVTP